MQKLFSAFLLLVICATALTTFSQANILPGDIRSRLLTAYQNAKVAFNTAHVFLCEVNEKQSPEELISLAWHNNEAGNWLCSEKIFSLLSESSRNLSSMAKLKFLLVRAGFMNAHQLFDSSKSLAVTASHEADNGGFIAEKAEALLIFSSGELKRRNISSAYSHSDSALQFSRLEGDKWLEGRALLQMAFCARRHFTSAAKRAFPYYTEAAALAESTGDSLTLFAADIYYGVDQIELENWEEGMTKIEKAVSTGLMSKNLFSAYTGYVCLGYALDQAGYYKESLDLYQKGMAVSRQLQLPYSMENSYSFVAGVFRELQRYDSAIYYANLAATVPGVDSVWANNALLKASIYNDMGDYRSASEMYSRALDWAGEDFLYRNEEQLSSSEAALNTKEKELEVGRQKKKSTQLEWIAGGIGILLLLFLWALIFQRRTGRKMIQKNAIIEKQRAALQSSLSEKEILLKEIHHRVKNNLTVISSLLELQLAGMENEKAKEALTEGRNRIGSISLVHERLYRHENLASIDLSGFATDLIRDISCVFQKASQKINTKLMFPETRLDIDTAVPLGLILNELLTNSFKYAFGDGTEGSIRLEVQTASPGNYILFYSDSGPGMPPGFDLKKSKSLGLRLIYRLSSQLGGHAEYRADKKNMFIIHFKDAVTKNEES
jgi:two-component sensor histidine kinase